MPDRQELPDRRPPLVVIEMPPVQGDAQYQLLRGGGVTAYVSHVFTPNREAGRALFCWGCDQYGSFDCDHVEAVRAYRAAPRIERARWVSALCYECGSEIERGAGASPDRFGRPRCGRCAVAAMRGRSP